jgi:hypothetical protein
MASSPSERNLREYLDSYNSLPFEIHQESFRRKALLKFLNSEDCNVATEIGCGRASIFEFWTPTAKSQTIEPIGVLLDHAKEKLQNPGIWRGFNARAEDMALSNELEKSDITILSSILHEVEDPIELLSASIALTRPGGLLAVIVTNQNSLHRILGVQLGFQDSLNQKTSTEIEMQQSHGAYSISELADELQQIGLRVLTIKTFFPKLFSHRQMSDFLESSYISLDFLQSMEALSDSLPGLGSEILAIAQVPND